MRDSTTTRYLTVALVILPPADRRATTAYLHGILLVKTMIDFQSLTIPNRM